MHPVIAQMRAYGHQYNPLIRGLFDSFEEEDWEQLTPEDYQGEALLSSYQMMMAADYEPLVKKYHDRLPQYDGLIGPATTELLTLDRCGCQDYMSLEEDEARGGGSWPAGCYPEIYKDHVLTIYIDLSNASSQVKNWWNSIQEAVFEAYAEIGLKLVPVKNLSEANIHLLFQSLGGNTIGLAQLPGSGATCSLRLWCKLDPGYYPSDNQVMKLLAHEIGHNLNSGHIAGDIIMNPSITQTLWTKSFRGTAFGSRLNGFFGGVPVPREKPDPPTDPKPPTGGGSDPLLDLTLENYKTGKSYVLKEVPKFGG